MRQTEKRLAQVQRGGRTHLVGRRHERLAPNAWPVIINAPSGAAHETMGWSQDKAHGLARGCGTRVARASPAQLRQMLAYTCTARGRPFLKVPARHATKTYAAWGSLSRPTGYAGVAGRPRMRAVEGTAQDRDVHAARHTLLAGGGMTHAYRREAGPGLPERAPWGSAGPAYGRSGEVHWAAVWPLDLLPP